MNRLVKCLRENVDFISPHEMPNISLSVMCHKLNFYLEAWYISQRKRCQSPEKYEATRNIVQGPLDAKFISEVKYSEWLSNLVLVKKAFEKWRICIDYQDLNRVCLKYSYPLPSIDNWVDNSYGYKLLLFMGAYFNYNQIPMYEPDKGNTTFLTEQANYQYNVISFRLKNALATY